MADRPPSPDFRIEPDTGTPRWVYAFGVATVVLVVVFVVVHLTVGGLADHGQPWH
jgi:hypothetical protein